MNAETAQNEKKVEDTQNNPEEGTVKTEGQQAEAKTAEVKTAEEKPKESVEPSSAAVNNLRVLENIEVKLTVEVGNTEIAIKDLLRLNEGSVVELDRLAGDPLDILANGTKIAKGEVVMDGEKFGIRFTEVSDPDEIVQNL